MYQVVEPGVVVVVSFRLIRLIIGSDRGWMCHLPVSGASGRGSCKFSINNWLWSWLDASSTR